jgi:hypothetical protein
VRALVDLVVVRRCGRDRLQLRIVWKGGETSELSVPIPVTAWIAPTEAGAMEEQIAAESARGIPDVVIAQHLTTRGYRSPRRPEVLPSTVSRIRRAQGIFQKPRLSRPRRVPGLLTVRQVAAALERSPHWIYHRIANGTIEVSRDPHYRTFLFPDLPETLLRLRQLRDGTVHTLPFQHGPARPEDVP